MVAKQVTSADLQNLKSEIKKENMEERHNLDNKLGSYFFKVDDLDKKSAVNDNILKTMSDNFNEMKELMNKINDKIDGFSDKFATKKSQEESNNKISSLEKAISTINLKIAGVSGGFAVVVFLIDKYAGK